MAEVEEQTPASEPETGAESATEIAGAKEVAPSEAEVGDTGLEQDLATSPMIKDPADPGMYLNNLVADIVDVLQKYPQEYLSVDMRNRSFNALNTLALAHCKFKLAAEPFMASAGKDANGVGSFVTQARPVLEDLLAQADAPKNA